MASIPDGKSQELNISFTFDQQQQDKAFINAHVDNVTYRLEFKFNPNIDFPVIKQYFLSKNYQIILKTIEILKFKISIAYFEFKNIDFITVNTLKLTVNQLSNKLQDQTHKNNILQNNIHDMRQQIQNMKQKLIHVSQQSQRLIFQKQLQALSDKIVQKQQQDKLSIQKIQKLEKVHQEAQRKLALLQQKQQEQRYKKLQQNIKSQKNRQINLIQQAQIQNSQYRFSSTYKNKQITLENSHTKASGYALASVEGLVFEKGSSISFRIVSTGMNVGVGLGLRNMIAENGYVIPNQTGHGCFLLSNSGISYSHSDKKHNYVFTDFLYIDGDVIIVQRDCDELIWKNVRTKLELKMKVKLASDEWIQASFCVYLINSAVEIMK